MNQELQKQFVLKLFGVSLLAAGAWFYSVGPQSKKLQALNEKHLQQMNDVEHGEQMIQQYQSQVVDSVDQMSLIREKIFQQLDAKNEKNVHKALQDSAESFGLTVSRIEPLRTVDVSNKESDDSKITLETKEFRVECSGPFDGVVRYIEDISTSQTIAKVDSFRVIPVSSDHVRVILQVSTYELVELPQSLLASLEGTASTMTLSGVTDE